MEGLAWGAMHGGQCLEGNLHEGQCMEGRAWRAVHGGHCVQGTAWRAVHGGLLHRGCKAPWGFTPRGFTSMVTLMELGAQQA